MRLPCALLAASATLALAAPAMAHIDVQEPTPRYLDGYDGQKTAPCGGGNNPSGVVTAWTVGQEVTVTFEEAINHSGHYRIALDPTGTDNFDNPMPAGSTAVVGNTIGFAPDDSGQAGNIVNYTFTVPDYDCDPCTLQVLQYMENAADPFYYFCADVKITSDSSSSTTTATSSTSGAGGSGQGGAGMGGEGGDSTTGSGYAQYPTFGAQDTGCAVAHTGKSSRYDTALLLLAVGAMLARRRERTR